MENNTIISLCMVGNKNDKTTELCRFADYIKGRFVPYTYNYNQDFFAEERDLLIGMNYDILADSEEIGVFEWFTYKSSDNQWRTSVKRNQEIPWCEVLHLDYVENPAMLIQMLKNGIKLETPFDGMHDLILVSRKDTAGMNAILLQKGMLKIWDSTVSLKEDVLKVPMGTVDLRAATASCQCRRSKYDKRRYLRASDGFVLKQRLLVKEPVEVVKDILQGNIRYFESDVLSRREKQLLRSVITRVTEPTIVDMVCSRLECTVEQAHSYINQYIQAARIKLDRQTALSIIEKLVESDVDAVLEMKNAVKEEWLSENKAIVAEKKKEIEHYNNILNTASEAAKKETERIKQATKQEESKQSRLAKENEELEKSVNDLIKLKEELEQEIQNRLNRARNDLAGTMLDHVLRMPATEAPPLVIPEMKAPKSFTVSFREEETEEAGIYDCHEVMQTDWNRICGDRDLSAGLSLIALAAFACNWPILVAGEGAELIADLLSVSICGHVPLKLRIRDEADLESLAEAVAAQNHRIICVINGLESGYLPARELMERFRDSRFIFTAMHGESLAMEPESLFSAFFPILTDYFYNGRIVQNLPTLDCCAELLKLENSEKEKQAFREAKKIVGKWLKDEFFAPLLKIRCARLVASMIILAKELDVGDRALRTFELELVLTPWLKCLRRTELLQRILESDTVIDAKKKNDLINYIGMGGM